LTLGGVGDGHVIEISRLEDLDDIAPVGPRTGPGKRTKAGKEWYVLRRFLRTAIPAGMFEFPIFIREGCPPDEPDFVMTRREAPEAVALFEITEATNEADQAERTAHERAGKSVALLGEFGGRFREGAINPGFAWASEIVDAVRRKRGKTIFESSTAERHLIIYPNSNASILLSDYDKESEAVENLRLEIAKDANPLARLANGCLIHIVAGYLICIDALGEMKTVAR
jgi:hypothetical protein